MWHKISLESLNVTYRIHMRRNSADQNESKDVVSDRKAQAVGSLGSDGASSGIQPAVRSFGQDITMQIPNGISSDGATTSEASKNATAAAVSSSPIANVGSGALGDSHSSSTVLTVESAVSSPLAKPSAPVEGAASPCSTMAPVAAPSGSGEMPPLEQPSIPTNSPLTAIATTAPMEQTGTPTMEHAQTLDRNSASNGIAEHSVAPVEPADAPSSTNITSTFAGNAAAEPFSAPSAPHSNAIAGSNAVAGSNVIAESTADALDPKVPPGSVLKSQSSTTPGVETSTLVFGSGVTSPPEPSIELVVEQRTTPSVERPEPCGALTAMPSASSPTASTLTDPASTIKKMDLPVPAWIVQAKEQFLHQDIVRAAGPTWLELIEDWSTYEALFGYPRSSVSIVHLLLLREVSFFSFADSFALAAYQVTARRDLGLDSRRAILPVRQQSRQ